LRSSNSFKYSDSKVSLNILGLFYIHSIFWIFSVKMFKEYQKIGFF
jgi:hypothetical protein